ncbi:MAG TPA: glycosyltransferase, partial [Chthoniobacterales bacterium]|nr:glycosyltransferase [Chthoniobacterales bacterium]
IERERPDIIESDDPYQVGWKALRLGNTHRIPIVAFYHSHFAEAYLRRAAERVGRWFSELVMRAARGYVSSFYNRFAVTLTPSAGISRVLGEWGVANVRKASLGVNTDVFHPGTYAPDDERTRLLYVGRLAPEKNTRTLCEAFSILAARSDRFELVVVGEGQERERLRRVQEATGRVHWIRYCAEPAELARFYRKADLFVHPGVEETFGLVALEAQACGTPVVGIRCTHMDEVILHEQSDWAEENTAEALAAAIERMSARLDLATLGLFAAREVARCYAWPNVFAHLFSIYEEVVARYRKR